MTKRYDVDQVPGELPSTNVDENVDLQQFQDLAHQTLKDLESGTANLVDTALWRDWLALTGKVRTFYTREKIVSTWKQNTPGLANITLQPAVLIKPTSFHSWIDVPFEFLSPHGKLVRACTGRISFQALSDGTFGVWMLVTTMISFIGQNHPDFPQQVKNGSENRAVSGTSNGSHNHINGNGEDYASIRYDAIVLGAGQCGLSAAGRLSAVGAKYAILEREAFVGKTWTQRYETVRQHTIREYNNLPFDRTWGENDPTLLPGKIVAEGFDNYIKRYNVNIWYQVETRAATWNSDRREWTLEVTVHGQERRVVCKHLIVAIGGGSGGDNLPHLDGTSDFQGLLLGSGAYKHSRDWAGKHGVVVGSATMAHDIAHDMYKAGLRSVTMVQRSKTAIYPMEWVAKGQEGLYNTAIPTAVADARSASLPNKILRNITAVNFNARGALEQERFDALERAGFRVDRKTPMFDNIFNRFGGYYIDVGASSLIARGEVKVKSGVPIKTLTAHGVEFADGTEISADVIVLATGQEHNHTHQLSLIVGSDIANSIDGFWGMDEEGEVRNVMKTAAPGLWLFAGNTLWARWWSRFIALGIQSDILGEPLKCVNQAA
ncbi:hypothetical protein M409DRAFT_17407 [Zasmidium cellare ATCC 36951]|uniref:FAD/NAD(P)-binding domain-containing protein n=1 Tax=Zasmidium cellare ATCC 36951 TaxID=1080233 RepID=A0A6A6CY68_ZASCE|nr:uncharacterized protein M409DRAFT_17407 [Zasmidium cellare ATCC 36951]KAF2172167.1 hypothetical protein M409DRAFT_17407 [Zasmidium cellare ATCC 36951]